MPLATLRHFFHRISSAAAHRNVAPLLADADPAKLAPDTVIPFRCNLCGTLNAVPLAALARETPSCVTCRSPVRFRSIAHLLVRELYGREIALPDLPRRKDFVGIGLSDAPAYADPLAKKLAYTNTFFHTTPHFDITALPDAMHGSCDFLIASDVFEHVAPPVAKAFANAKRLLKPGGVFVFTVPFTLEPDTAEHFPELADFRIAQEHGVWRLHNRTIDGREQVYDDLVFHGGPGTTLEMRLFSRAGLLREFAAAGFRDVRIAAEPCLPFGIVWPEPWSVPIVARA